jgi:hypothetical protein
MMNWEGCERKRSWTAEKGRSEFTEKEGVKHENTLVRTVGLRVENRTRDLRTEKADPLSNLPRFSVDIDIFALYMSTVIHGFSLFTTTLLFLFLLYWSYMSPAICKNSKIQYFTCLSRFIFINFHIG